MKGPLVKILYPPCTENLFTSNVKFGLISLFPTIKPPYNSYLGYTVLVIVVLTESIILIGTFNLYDKPDSINLPLTRSVVYIVILVSSIVS